MVKIKDIYFGVSVIFCIIFYVLWLTAEYKLKEVNNKLEYKNNQIIKYEHRLDSLEIRKYAEQEILHNMSDSDAVVLFYKLLSDK